MSWRPSALASPNEQSWRSRFRNASRSIRVNVPSLSLMYRYAGFQWWFPISRSSEPSLLRSPASADQVWVKSRIPAAALTSTILGVAAAGAVGPTAKPSAMQLIAARRRTWPHQVLRWRSRTPRVNALLTERPPVDLFVAALDAGAVLESGQPLFELKLTRRRRAVREGAGEAEVFELVRIRLEVVALDLGRILVYASPGAGVHDPVVLHVDLAPPADAGKLAGRVARQSGLLVLGHERAGSGPPARSVEKRDQRAPVHGPAAEGRGARRAAGELEDGWSEVDVGGGLGAVVHTGRAAAVALRHLDHEGQVKRLLVGEDLARRQAVLAEEEAVVRQEYEHGAPELARLLHGVVDLLHSAIDPGQGGERAPPAAAKVASLRAVQAWQRAQERRLVGHVLLVEGGRPWERSVPEAPLVLRLGDGGMAAGPVRVELMRDVRRALVELEVERLSLGGVAVDPPHRVVVQDVRQVVLLRMAVRHDPAVHEVVVVVVLGFAQHRAPLLPARSDR